MILKELYLYPDLVQYPESLTGAVRDQARCLCNYLERTVLKKLRFKTEGFKRICVIGSRSPKQSAHINTSNVACVEVKFSEGQCSSGSGIELDEYFISLLTEGLDNLNKQYPIPVTELKNGLEEFRNNGYKNEWLHQSKAIKTKGLKASLYCKLTNKNFSLTLAVSNGDSVVFEKEVLNTVPDEIVFVPMFKELIVSESTLQLTNKTGKVVYDIPLSSFA